MKKLLLTLTLLLGLVAAVKAADVTVGDVALTSGTTYTSSNLKYLGSGSITYNSSSKLLTLTNAVINTGNKTGLTLNLNLLKVKLVGTNNITTESSGAYGVNIQRPTNFIGTGNLTITSQNSGLYFSGNYELFFQEDVTVTAEGGYGVHGQKSSFGKIRLENNAILKLKGSDACVNYTDLSSLGTGFAITGVKGAKYSNGTVVDANGSVVKGVYLSIEKATAITSTRFPDANFRNWVLAQSYGADGYLTKSEIASVTSVYVDNQNIADLTGIEYFTAMKYMSCADNKLTTLDVSKNTELITLSCYGNQLTTLDLSKNTKLETVYCYGNQINGVKSINFVSDLPTTSGANLAFYNNEPATGNWMTPEQVETAKDKGWNVKMRDTFGWVDYEGSGIAIDETNFPDYNFLYFYVRDFDSDGDGILNPVEIAAVTSINVNYKKITNLKGIEYFTALTELRCSNNQLNSLDVSKNTALTYLDCSSNKLSTLDVTQNTALEYLNCSSNSLSSLNVTKNTALTYLNCSSNKLSTLDVSKNTALTYLGCSSNQLSTLDVSRNTALEKMYCGGNHQLNSLDVSKNTALIWLDCQNSQLSALDVSKNTALTMLHCLSNQLSTLDLTKNTALSYLDCSGNQLNSLDVTKNTALTEMWCGGNQLTTLDVSKNTALTVLWCNNNLLTTLDVTNNTVLDEIRFYHNLIRGDGMTALVNSLCDRSTMYSGYFCIYYDELPNGNMMTTVQVEAAKAKNWMVVMADGDYWVDYEGVDPGIPIDETNFPDEIFRNWVLAQDYGADGYLTDEEIAGVTSIDVSAKGIASLKGIEYFTALTKLYCEVNSLKELDVSKNTALKQLRCEHNGLRSLDVSKNTALEELYCHENGLTTLDVSGCTALDFLSCFANGLKTLDVTKNKALKFLVCHQNQLESLDVSKNTALKSLECFLNQLTSLNVSNCTALETLECYYNQLTSLNVSNFTALTGLSCTNNQLESLDVTGCTALTDLRCFSNKIGAEAMGALVESLPTVSSGTFQVVNTEDENEGNVITKAQVQKAKDKGWRVNTEGVHLGIAIDATNFPDENFRNWVLAQTYGADALLTDEEIAGVTKIDVYSKGIASLKGIEYFTALEDLDCGGNQLESLDVTKNTALIHLNCDDNKLKTLDVSGCTALDRLICNINNLTMLDVTKNTALTRLDCYFNQIGVEAMGTLVESLPTVNSGSFIVVITNNENEGNVITKPQVKKATEKGWTVNTEGVTPEGEEAGSGDANGDSVVDASDLEIVRNYILGNTPDYIDEDAADVNGDGVVDIVDLTKLIEMMKDPL